MLGQNALESMRRSGGRVAIGAQVECRTYQDWGHFGAEVSGVWGGVVTGR